MYLDQVAWRETRLCVSLFVSFTVYCNNHPHLQIQFFAHLTVAKVISAESMCTLLRSFVAVLDEFGVSYGRAKKAALCAGDGLIIVSLNPPCLLLPINNCLLGGTCAERLFANYHGRNNQCNSDIQRDNNTAEVACLSHLHNLQQGFS